MNITRTSLLVGVTLLLMPQVSLAQAFTSDDFNCVDLDPVWTYVDPLNGGTWNLVGSATGEACLNLILPAGNAHDAWGAGGVNQSIRMMQPASNVDSKIEVRFKTEPSGGFNDQGILVEQDATNWLRADVYNPGTGLKLFVGKTVAGVNTSLLNADIPAGSGAYLLVERSGDTWSVSHSPDGTNWTLGQTFNQAYAVSQVGVYAANPVDGLAWTSEVDWFFEQDNPVDPEDPLNTDRCIGPTQTETSTWGKVKATYR